MTPPTPHWLGLSGQTAAVTGAASGIGAAIATEMARVGVRVALLDRDAAGVAAQAQALQAEGLAAHAVVCDVADPDSVRAAAADALTHWQLAYEKSACDILVNNAGLLRPGHLDAVSEADWATVMAINLNGYWHCARAFGESMKAQGAGSLVHVASISGLFPQSGSGAYSASKAAVLALSRQLAVEWGPLGIRSNAICPGMIRTPLSAKFYEVPGFEAKRAAVTASRRIGEGQDIANVAAFLASPRAGYVNGAEWLVDGGMANMLMDMVPRPGYNATN